MRIAVIGLGEVGRCYAAALHRAGFALGVCEARPSDAAKAIAQSLGLPIHPQPGEWLSDADWVLSCVTGSVAKAVVDQIAGHLRTGAAIADLTTASPEVKLEAARDCTGRGMRYVDVAIMGGISLHLEKTPLLASGDGADEFVGLLARCGSPVKVIEGGAAGDAMSLKILRSVFTKGMEALSVELLMSAEKQGVREKLYAQLLDIDETPLRTFIDMLVRTHVVHARRRAHEVHDAQSELKAQGLRSMVLPGVEARFLATATALETQPLPAPQPSIEQALAWLLSNAH